MIGAKNKMNSPPRSGGRTVLGAKERRVREPTPQEETAAQAKE